MEWKKYNIGHFATHPEEYDRVMAAAQHCANEAHATDQREPMGREAIPLQEPMWDYNTPKGEACRDGMFRYLFAVRYDHQGVAALPWSPGSCGKSGLRSPEINPPTAHYCVFPTPVTGSSES
ncbi:hypothetical protein MM560_G114n52 [Manis javanica]|nr:hypothetical protein MM560_G114n52 [Manis javanica]